MSEEVTITVKVPESVFKLIPRDRLIRALTLGLQQYLEKFEEMFLALKSGAITKEEWMRFCLQMGIEAGEEAEE